METSIDDWLDQEICCFPIINKNANKPDILPMNRRELIRTVRDKDGGAHFDNSISEKKEYLVLKNGIKMDLMGEKVTAENLHLALLRQMGYEILSSPDLKSLLDFEQLPNRNVDSS